VTAFNYNIFGLSIRSEFEIPELSSNRDEEPEVDIQYGEVPENLDNKISSGILYESAKQKFLLKLPNVGKYLATNGNQIIVDPKPGATNDEIRLFLLGSVFGAILHQRGYLPLHGSAVKIHNEAMVIIGNSAAGKSTLAASLDKAGYSLISDDISAILLKESGQCVILGGTPFLKLWKDTTDILYPNSSFSRVRPQIRKYRIPAAKINIPSIQLTVLTVLKLTSINQGDFKIHSIYGANKFSVLRDHVFRDQMIKGMGIQESHFHLLSTLANQIELFHIERPSAPLKIVDLRNLVINEIINR